MTTDVEFRLLGPLAVVRDGVVLPLPSGKQRALLAALLLRRGEVLSVADLVNALWGADPPPSARVSVQNHVMRLRGALGDAGKLLATVPGGYLFRVAAEQVDVHQFEVLIRAARAAARSGSWPEASASAAQALGLWRGTPLADLDAEALLAREGPRLEELRLQALEIRIDADMHLGRHGEAIAELQRLIAAEPLRERLHALLMLALYADGEQAEAMAAYQRARRILAAELGTEPGPALHDLHQQILTGQVEVPRATQEANTSQPSEDAAAAAPRELPTDVAAFTGRTAELAALDQLLLNRPGSGESATAAVISAVSGTAGVGKTALAIHWAHHAAAHFPDGQLHVNLRGYDLAQPVTAGDALAGFLRSLGVPGQEIPAEETERAARYRSILAGKRMLLVLDNAATVDQVRPLLPGHADCKVLVTSRDSLAGLVARDGAKRLDLDLLPLDDAVALLADLIGERAAVAPDSLTQLADQCACLPLALRIAAELAAARPATPLSDVVTELADEQNRLDLLNAEGDPHTAVRAVFSWSYDNLDERTARVFRLAGLHPGADFDDYAVAALTKSTLDQARNALQVLTRAHLMQYAAPGRHSMHDLLRAYARDLTTNLDGDEETRAALTRLFNHYRSTAGVAMDALHPASRDLRPRIPPVPGPAPSVSEPATALAWLEGERPNLIASAVHSTGSDWPEHVIALSRVLYYFLQDTGHLSEMVVIHEAAQRAARHTGDLSAEANALTGMGTAKWRRGQYPEAAHHHRQALALFRSAGDRSGQGRSLHNLGVVAEAEGDYGQAADYEGQALALFCELGDRASQAVPLMALGNLAEFAGDYHEAAEHLESSLRLFRELGDPTGEAMALSNLSIVRARLGQFAQTVELNKQALALYRQTGFRRGEASALTNLGDAEYDLGHYREAVDWNRQALELAGEVGDPALDASIRNGLGRALLAEGLTDDALREHTVALALASQIGHSEEEARGHDGLGQCHRASGDDSQAREHWLQALALYAERDMPEADEVRARLADLDSAEPAKS